jgi:hypothetical protein
VAEINASTFFKSPFNGLMASRQLTEYTIMDIDKVSEKERRKFSGQGAISKKVGRFDYVEPNPTKYNFPILLIFVRFSCKYV